MNALETLLRDEIKKQGAIPFAKFMEMCLFHENFGYYNTHDPLKDFTTAPEISQLFGEMITLWCVDAWMKLGSPSAFTLLECGPGRGTLMADVLRTAAIAPEFSKAMRVHLLEKSPLLKGKQQEALKPHNVKWIDGLDELSDQPIIMFCNELFDAFPVQPFVKTQTGWGERGVTVVDNELTYSVFVPDKTMQAYFNDDVFKEAPIGAITELNVTANDWVKNLAHVLKENSGAALIIDYGYAGPELANTVQAIFEKKMSPLFKHVGYADMTAHIDFTPFQVIAKETGIQASALQPMGHFLETCGIKTRAERLKLNATPEQQEQIDVALHRLLASEHMGHLFKVLCLYHKMMAPPIGCEA